jgi:hypothetical protein
MKMKSVGDVIEIVLVVISGCGLFYAPYRILQYLFETAEVWVSGGLLFVFLLSAFVVGLNFLFGIEVEQK